MENYICLNGVKVELTEEQVKALGFESKIPESQTNPKPSPFKIIPGGTYYYINEAGNVLKTHDANIASDIGRRNSSNYCTDEALMKQRALHETLNRLLWRYSREHGGVDECGQRWEICYDDTLKWRAICVNAIYLAPTFSTRKIAEGAINEVVIPFIEAHPEFNYKEI